MGLRPVGAAVPRGRDDEGLEEGDGQRVVPLSGDQGVTASLVLGERTLGHGCGDDGPSGLEEPPWGDVTVAEGRGRGERELGHGLRNSDGPNCPVLASNDSGAAPHVTMQRTTGRLRARIGV